LYLLFVTFFLLGRATAYVLLLSPLYNYIIKKLVIFCQKKKKC